MNNIMLLKKSASLVFKVRRNPPELVAPAGPTPHETKLLSDIDDQKGLHCHIPLMQFFRYHPSMKGKDPVQVIREAVAKTLVFYYPLAGRLRERSPNGKLMVDCNGEGVMFIEAHADVTLDQFGIHDLHPPFPCCDELFYIVPGSDGIINYPVILIQVTRLMCGGLICAMQFNHVMLDGIGINQFMMALTEMARGEPKPSIMPVWCRELLCARNPPRVTCVHHEYQQLPFHNKNNYHPLSFFVGSKEIAAMRRLLPPDVARSAATFEVLTAYLWRCHTAAMQWQNPDQEIRLLCIANARFEPSRLNPPIPEGFYGNAAVAPAAVSTMRNLCRRPLEYALELVKKAKNEATEEYVHSVADLMAIEAGRTYFTRGSIMVSDLTKFWQRDVDYGWGKSLFNGPPNTSLGEYHGSIVYVPYTNSGGEQGKLVLICLPQEAIERFETELNGMLNIDDKHPKILNSNL